MSVPVLEPPVAPQPLVVVQEVVTATPLPNVSQEDISELKKELKRQINKRAIYVATKLSGVNQDSDLRACDSKANRVDAEIAALKTLKSSGAVKLPATHRSEFISPQHLYNVSPESLIASLELVRAEIKDQVRYNHSTHHNVL